MNWLNESNQNIVTSTDGPHCNSMERERPDGEDEDNDELDPRVEIELEKLNTASNDINILEKQLDEARSMFRQRLTDAARNLKTLAKDIGSHIDKARPYFEAVSQAKKAQLECQNAAVTFERACQVHKGARDTIAVAEDKLMQNPGMFDAAWQEMLNNANYKIMEAEKEKLVNENMHHEAAMAYRQLEERATGLENKLRKTINKARPYFQERAQYLGYLETQKVRVQQLEASYAAAKKQYSDSLRNLELISEDIHKKRNEASHHPPTGTPKRPREECVGAETIIEKPSRRRSTLRRQSEDRIKQALARKRYANGRFRSSLVLDLDIDFDLGDDLDYGAPSKSPSSKSVDIGYLEMNYYNDYQVLDVAPFLERERAMTADSGMTGDSGYTNISIGSHSPVKSRSVPTTPRHKVRTDSTLSNNSLSSIEEISTSGSYDDKSRTNSVRITDIDSENSFISKDVSPALTRKESRMVLINRCSKILEADDVNEVFESDYTDLSSGTVTDLSLDKVANSSSENKDNDIEQNQVSPRARKTDDILNMNRLSLNMENENSSTDLSEHSSTNLGESNTALSEKISEQSSVDVVKSKNESTEISHQYENELNSELDETSRETLTPSCESINNTSSVISANENKDS